MIGSHKMGKRTLCLVLCLVCLAALALPALAVDTEEVPTAVQPTEAQTLTCAVHYGPGNGYAVIGWLEEGATVTVLSERSSYYKIDCYEMNGYIAKTQVAQREDGTYYVNCKTDSADTKVMVYTPYADAIRMRHAIVELAKEQVGDPYVFGSARPGGFDCSGLTSFLYKEQGIAINRRASTQLQDGIIVSREGLMPGDLVFFHDNPGDGYEASHVGVYIGDGKIIHSGSKGVGYAELDGHWFRDYYIGARRVINTDNTQLRESVTATILEDTGALRTPSGRTAP